METSAWRRLVYVLALSLGTVLLAWTVSRPQSSAEHFALVWIVSAGVLFLVEAALLRRHDTSALDGRREQMEAWFWRVGAALVLVVVICLPSMNYRSHPPDDEHLIARIRDEIKHLLPPAGPSGAGQGPIDVTLKLDPGLENLLRERLTSPPAPHSLLYWGILIAAFVAAAALIGWAILHKPEGTAVATGIATLTAVGGVIAKLVGDKIPKPVGALPGPALTVSVILLVVGILLVGVGGWYLFWLISKALEWTPPPPSPNVQPPPNPFESGSLLAAALLVYGFSALLMALVPALLLGTQAPSKTDCPKCGTVTDCSKCQSVITASSFEVKSLPAITRMGNSRPPEVDPTKIEDLASELRAQGKEGDILLLLGSADCLPTRPNGVWKDNEELAGARANSVLTGLQGKLHGVQSKSLAMPQYERCAKTLDMRAVYPFLIYAKDAQDGGAARVP